MRLRLDIQRFASGTVNLGTSGKLAGQVLWTSTSNGSNANTSTVNITLQIKRTDQYYTLGTFTGNTVIAGTSVDYSWYGRIENNTWQTVATQQKTVRHNDDGTGTAQIGGGVQGPSGTTMSGNSLSYSTIVNLDTIPRYPTVSQSLNSIEETKAVINWSSDSTCDYVWYKIGSGSWIAVGSINATSGSYTITGLTAGTSYNIYTKVRRKDSQLPKETSALSIKTYSYPYVKSNINFNIGSAVNIQIENPLNRRFDLSVLGADNSLIKKLTNINGTSTGNILDDTTSVDNLYRSIPSSKDGVYKVKIECSGNTDTRNAGTYTALASNVAPIFSANDFRYFDDDPDVIWYTENNQYLVSGMSDCAVIIEVDNRATAQKYATMVKYKVKIGSKYEEVSYSSQMDVSCTIDDVDGGEIIVYAVDSRGFETEVRKSADRFIVYTPLANGPIEIARDDGISEDTLLKFSGTFWNDSFGGWSNKIWSGTIYYKKTTDDDIPENWQESDTSLVTRDFDIDENTYSYEGYILGDTSYGFNIANSYDIKVRVKDTFSEIWFYITLGSGTPNMAFVEGGISLLGMYNENDTTNKLQINGNTKIIGNESVNGDIDITGVYKINGTALSIPTLDSAVSTTSTNGVENQAITNYVNNHVNDIVRTSATKVGSYITTIDSNIVLKNNKIVQFQFRGYVNTTIPNNTSFIKLPYSSPMGADHEVFIGVGGHYDNNSGIKWGYMNEYNEIRCGGISAGNWIHINFTYITNQ